ncbi:hypothetical protein XENOCAPTIV_009397 [Xenoophorus captivus]|uniref:Uncharacterized protein n=1 Tax=Xenoophorus captivus TaxID=1517983 RepID=A0ABV0RR59_9TELE
MFRRSSLLLLSHEELLGTSCYEYFHQDDLLHLAERHRKDCKKTLPVIPGISFASGTMIFAGSIGTQIANELLDFNKYGIIARVFKL